MLSQARPAGRRYTVSVSPGGGRPEGDVGRIESFDISVIERAQAAAAHG